MASERQIAANRRNAERSTGPRTISGKLRSRRNAFRHGLTAATVITSLEETSDYQKLERGLFEDYGPLGAVEKMLVARLASLLWRLQRATLIETGLFEIEGSTLQCRHREQLNREARNPALEVFYRLLNEPHTAVADPTQHTDQSTALAKPVNTNANHLRKIDMASIYLRLCRIHPSPMKRLGRYETALWRQLAQTLLLLETAMRNRPTFRKLFPGGRK